MVDITYRQLRREVQALAKDVRKGAEGVRTRAKAVDEEAKDTTRVAEMIAGMGVSPHTVAETRELAKIMRGVSEASIAYATASDTTAKAADAADAQARASHEGIQQAVSKSPDHAKNHKWYRQE